MNPKICNRLAARDIHALLLDGPVFSPMFDMLVSIVYHVLAVCIGTSPAFLDKQRLGHYLRSPFAGKLLLPMG